MKILILDDEKYRHEGLEGVLKGPGVEIWHAYDCQRAMKVLEEVGPFDEAYLDYNLGTQKELTGLDAARYIVKMPKSKRPRMVRIHSWHPTGAWRMQQALEDGDIPVVNEPFGQTVARLRQQEGSGNE